MALVLLRFLAVFTMQVPWGVDMCLFRLLRHAIRLCHTAPKYYETQPAWVLQEWCVMGLPLSGWEWMNHWLCHKVCFVCLVLWKHSFVLYQEFGGHWVDFWSTEWTWFFDCNLALQAVGPADACAMNSRLVDHVMPASLNEAVENTSPTSYPTLKMGLNMHPKTQNRLEGTHPFKTGSCMHVCVYIYIHR